MKGRYINYGSNINLGIECGLTKAVILASLAHEVPFATEGHKTYFELNYFSLICIETLNASKTFTIIIRINLIV